MISSRIHKTLVGINAFALIYFIVLIVASSLQWDYQALQIVGELITIPLILFVILSFIYSLIALFKKPLQRAVPPILFLSFISLLIIGFATMNQM